MCVQQGQGLRVVWLTKRNAQLRVRARVIVGFPPVQYCNITFSPHSGCRKGFMSNTLPKRHSTALNAAALWKKSIYPGYYLGGHQCIFTPYSISHLGKFMSNGLEGRNIY